MSDYDNPYGMSDQEFEYRAMNPQDPMYMGDRYSSSPYSPGDVQPYGNLQDQQTAQKKNPEDEKDCWDIPEGLFIIIVFVLIGLFIWGALWLLTL